MWAAFIQFNDVTWLKAPAAETKADFYQDCRQHLGLVLSFKSMEVLLLKKTRWGLSRKQKYLDGFH